MSPLAQAHTLFRIDREWMLSQGFPNLASKFEYLLRNTSARLISGDY